MEYINSDFRGSYYVDFDVYRLYFFNRTSRIGKSSRFFFNMDSLEIEIEDAEVDSVFSKTTRVFLLPLIDKHLRNKDKRSTARQIAKSISYDLDDSACRDFNSFG